MIELQFHEEFENETFYAVISRTSIEIETFYINWIYVDFKTVIEFFLTDVKSLHCTNINYRKDRNI